MLRHDVRAPSAAAALNEGAAFIARERRCELLLPRLVPLANVSIAEVCENNSVGV